MGFWKRRQQKVNGLWYPQSVTMGTIDTDKIIERLAQISTVSKSDVQAVLGDLATVMADYMSLGYTVKLDGLGPSTTPPSPTNKVSRRRKKSTPTKSPASVSASCPKANARTATAC